MIYVSIFFSDGTKLINLKIRTPDMAPPYGPGGIATLASLAGGGGRHPDHPIESGEMDIPGQPGG